MALSFVVDFIFVYLGAPKPFVRSETKKMVARKSELKRLTSGMQAELSRRVFKHLLRCTMRFNLNLRFVRYMYEGASVQCVRLEGA